MKLNEKIRHLRRDVLGLSLKEFYQKLVAIFGDNALTYYSLCRLEKGHRAEIRMRSLYQICAGLGISLKELKEGTDEQESRIVSILSHKERSMNKYVYNEKAVAEIISPRSLSFLAMELSIAPQGVTKPESDPIETSKFEKLIVVLNGELLVHVGKETHKVKRGDSISFASNIIHYFENPSASRPARCLVVQNPKSY